MSEGGSKWGLVIRNTGNNYLVRTDDGDDIPCLAKGSFRLKGIRSTSPVVVGDKVRIGTNSEGTAYITEIEDRKNYIVRRASNLSKQAHILAANIDLALLCITVRFPETTTVFIDRFLVTAEAYSVPVHLVFNKTDIYDSDDRACIWLRVRSSHDHETGSFSQTWEFLNGQGESIPGRAQLPELLNSLQRMRPIFYLSALRDAGKEFAQRSQFWAPFLRNIALDPERKRELEEMMGQLNDEIIAAHGALDAVRNGLQGIQSVVPVGSGDVVSIEAVPTRVFDILGKAQVGIASATNARLPVAQHGEGTQSLAVLFLFSVFVDTQLGSAYDELSRRLSRLRNQKHISIRAPCARSGG